MARCGRCNKFMFMAPKSGFCRECELLNVQDKIAEEQRLRIETEKKLREEEERRHAAEIAKKAAEEERRQAEEAAQKAAEEAEKRRRAEEEAAQKAAEEEKERRRIAAAARKAAKAEEERRRAEEEEATRKAAEEKERRRIAAAVQKVAKEVAEEENKKPTSPRLSKAAIQAEYDMGEKLFGSSNAAEKKQAYEHFLKAAEAGLAIAQTQVGNMLIQGEGAPKDVAAGIMWTEKAAQQGYALAEANLAGFYFRGNGVPRDKKRALELYKRAAAQNDDYSQFMIGKMYTDGDPIPKDDKKAREYFIKAASNGNQNAMMQIIADQLYLNLCGARQCRVTLKEEFEAYFGYIKKCIPVRDCYVSQENFDVAIAAKRGRNYVRASRVYFMLTMTAQVLPSNIANAWLKTLAAAGDVKDAIALGEYVLNAPGVERSNPMGWQLLESNTNTLKSYVASKDWGSLLNRCIEIGGGHGSGETLQLNDIDVYRDR